MKTKYKNLIAWIPQLMIAFILGGAAYGKLSSQATDVFIFQKLQMEPAGRFLIGTLEALTVFLILIPRLSALGASLAIAIMLGALLAHLGPLGFEVQGDGGKHIVMLGLVLISSLILAWIRRSSLPLIGRLFRRSHLE
ncbi:MAG: DoxX family protein [Deltaproteobacteria bacterium]|nr:DoxX family protein [Deltaproteobacteria bacterium]